MTRAQALADLIAKVDAGECRPSHVWNKFDAIMPSTGIEGFAENAMQAYKGSLDAALSLHKAVLPGWVLERLTMWPGLNGECTAHLWGTHEEKDGERWHNFVDGRTEAKADTPARAWLLAILKALHAQEQETTQ